MEASLGDVAHIDAGYKSKSTHFEINKKIVSKVGIICMIAEWKWEILRR